MKKVRLQLSLVVSPASLSSFVGEHQAAKVNRNGKLQWFSIATLLLAIILLFLAFRGVDWRQMLAVLQRGRPDYLLLACLTLSVSYFVRGLRWRILLSAEKFVPPVTVFWGTMVGYLGNNLMPARAGDLIRPVVLGRNTNLSKGFILGTILAERGIDLVAVVLISMGVLASLKNPPEWLPNATQVTAGLGLTVLMGLFLVPHYEKLLVDTLTRLRWLPDAFRAKAVFILQRVLLGMRAFQHPIRAVSFAGLTVVVWLIDAYAVILVGHALELSLILPEALLLLAALALSSAIPSTPGYVGVYQFVAVSALPAFGFSRGEALAYIIAFQAMAYSVVILWGFLGLWQLGGWGKSSSDNDD